MPSEIVLGLIPFFYIWPPTLPSSLTPTHIASHRRPIRRAST